jgi:aromatic-L-amino-acid decarboxylase
MPGLPLEPSPQKLRALGEAALTLISGFIEGLEDTPASRTEGGLEVARDLLEHAPETSADAWELLGTLREAARYGYETAGPGYLAYIPGGGLPTAAIADMLACALNRYVTVWNVAPALVQLEANVLRWLASLFEYPGQSRGILTSGGSMANFSAVVTARRALLGEDFGKGVLYISAQAHHSVTKAAMLAGFRRDQVRTVRSTASWQMDPQALREAVRQDRARGLAPFLLVASAGTTNTGTIDPLLELGTAARDLALWFHVDAAYGGFFQLTQRGRRRLAGITAADSITLDPHKGLFLPYGTGCLLVKDGEKLRAAHRLEADYLQDLEPENEIPSFADYSPELSRDFRGLRVWLPLKLHGLDAFRAALDEKLDLAARAYARLSSEPLIERTGPPDLTVIPLWHRGGSDRTRAGLDDINRRWLAAINRTQRIFISSTNLDGRFTPRFCILSFRTHKARVDEAVEIACRTARELVGTAG